VNDADVVARWWQQFVATGEVARDLQLVQGRLIRNVHRGALPSGGVHVKTMTFPRKKDRLRYAFRALPAAHEAAMLRATAAHGIPCPEVLAVRVQRRLGLPHRSMLVLRTLDVVDEPHDATRRCRDEVALAQRLLQAGIEHRDLHGENFVRLRSGELAVLDMQSASVSAAAKNGEWRVRAATAARLLRDRFDDAFEHALRCLREAGLLRDDREAVAVRARVDADRRRFHESRIRRCLTTSTEFVRTVQWNGVRYALREGLGEGRWIRGGRAFEGAWLGQRRRQLRDGTPPVFRAFFRGWWWLGGGAALYVPATCNDEQLEAVLTELSGEPGKTGTIA